jgi:predicted CXXCH cytochrome family protein
MLSLRILLAGLLLGASLLHAQDTPDNASASSAVCLDCHDFGPDSPVHAVLAGSHGLSGDQEAMAGRRGCPDCHGASDEHARAPEQVAPGVSFGPRWSASPAAQDAKCLACHEQDSARNWQHALHMLNNLTCVTCHDVHSWQDKVLVEDQQAQVCTTCHKAQQQGIHGIEALAPDNPPCSACHNPHDHESAQARMLDNGSAGCLVCHDPFGAEAAYSASAKANNYHRVAARPGHTCLDCHQGIAHAPTDTFTAMEPQALGSRQVTLFYPGDADSDWLLRDHPGSQPLRQGRNCQQCHRGEETRMGTIQADGQLPPARAIQVSFTRTADELIISLAWEGSAQDRMLALMWDDGGSEVFTRGGCFAACHADLPDMNLDSGESTRKYLWNPRTERPLPGHSAAPRSSAELAQAMAAGEFLSLWQLQLDSGKLQTATLLDGLTWLPTNLIQINKSHVDGQWTVELRAPLDNTQLQKPFTADNKYTFGIALGAEANPGGGHWVSLPLTLSLAGDETDFKVEQE